MSPFSTKANLVMNISTSLAQPTFPVRPYFQAMRHRNPYVKLNREEMQR